MCARFTRGAPANRKLSSNRLQSPETTPSHDEPSPRRKGRIVTEESSNGRDVGNGWGSCVEFPVGDGQWVDSNCLGDFSLIEPSQLDPIFRALQQAGIRLRERHEEWERQRRINEQRELERQKAERQRKKLFEDLDNWTKADQLRSMIAKSTELLKDQKADLEYAERWLKWAEGHAAYLDPFSEGLEGFFKHYETDSWVISRSR
jgi:hypothetical protein